MPVSDIVGFPEQLQATPNVQAIVELYAGRQKVVTVTQSATPAIDTDLGGVFSITGLAQAVTSMTTNLTGTPAHGQFIWIELTDDGTGRAITWGTKFASTTVILPTTTVGSAILRVQFTWNAVSSTWDCLLVA